MWLLEDFLLKRLKTISDVRKLQQHTRPAYSSGLFKQPFEAPREQESLEEIEGDDLRELHSQCLQKIDQVLSMAQDSEEFNLMMPDNLKELTTLVHEQTKAFGFSETELELVFKHLARDTSELIREHELGQASGEED